MCLMYLVLLIIAIQILRLIFADGDLTLMWAERFGKKPAALARQVVWITGASMGLGEGLAYEMAKAGCRVVLSARSKELLEAIKQKCLSTGRVSADDVMILPFDNCDISSHQTLVEQVLQKYGQIDILVNNAGRSQRAFVVDTELEVDRQMIELNVISQISLTKCVLPHMIQRRSGHVVITSSVAGKTGVPFSATYCLTKFGVNGWFHSLAYELIDKNIAVTVVCPGPVVSNVAKAAFTGRPGQAFEAGPSSDEKNRMSTARCAELMAVAIANRLQEVWISSHPVLVSLYFIQYAPSLSWMFASKFGIKRMMKMREGK
jgi:dehydrogenase/reductase SDR family protein 7